MAETVKPGPALPKPAEPKPKAVKAKPSRAPAKNKGLIFKLLEVDILRCKVHIAIRVADKNTFEFMPSDIDTFYTLLGNGSREEVSFDLTDTAGFVQGRGLTFVMGMLVYSSTGETFPRVSLSVLVHECDHCASAMLTTLGMSISDRSGDEVHANICGYLARSLYKLLLANNVFIDNGS